MHPTDHAQKATVAPSHDGFFPSARFAKVPAEALDALAYEGPHKLSHAEFRLFVALCRFRGISRIVNPCQETLAAMTGIARSNVSRTAQLLQAKGWVRIQHVDGDPRKRVSNYELLIPVRGASPGVPSKPKKMRKTKAPLDVAETSASAVPPVDATGDAYDASMAHERDELLPPDDLGFDGYEDASLTDEELSEHVLAAYDLNVVPVDDGAESMSPEELDEVLEQLAFEDA
jgi:hypothetical protein